MKNLPAQLSLVLFAAAFMAGEASAQEWTRFRGPNGTGISESKGVPVKWTESDFRWRVPVPGRSHSQPVIWGEKLFVTSAEDNGQQRMILCFNKDDGQTLWVKKVVMGTHRKNRDNSYSSCTPTVDKDRVYACFVDTQKYVVKAWDHSGKELWSVNLGPFDSQHGYASSPMLYEGRLILTNDQRGNSSIVALDARSGRIVWKTARRNSDATAYGVPCVLKIGRGAQLLTTSNSYGISALDPRSGRILWESGGIFDKRSVASPVVAGTLVFGSCGSGAYSSNYLVAVRAGGRGNVSRSHLAYKLEDKKLGKKITPYVPTPLVIGDRVYLFQDKQGHITCLQASTGKIVWHEEGVGQGGFYGSPVAVDGKIYCGTKRGQMIVFEAGDRFKLLAKNPLGEGSHSTPCVDGGRLYVKTFSHLVCIGGK